MRLEHQVFLKLCAEENDIQLGLTNEEVEWLDWSELLWQFLSHKVSGFVVNKSIQSIPLYDIDRIAGKVLRDNNRNQRKRLHFLYKDVLPKVIKTIEEVTEEYLFLKGIVSAISLYAEPEQRGFNDIDILIQKKDLKKVKKALYNQGFISGNYDFEANKVSETTLEAIKFMEMTTHQTYPLLKVVDQSFCDVINLDLNFGLGPEKNLRDKEFIQAILDRRQEYVTPFSKIRGMSKTDHFLHCMLHIFRDATTTFHIQYNKDIQLYQYIELHKMILKWHDVIEWDYLIELSNKHDFAMGIYYALYHCQLIFEDIKPYIKDLMNSIQPIDLNYLNQFGFENEERGNWEMSFIERIFCKNRYLLIKDIINDKNFDKFKKRQKFKDEFFEV